jgi:hypothetical protein
MLSEGDDNTVRLSKLFSSCSPQFSKNSVILKLDIIMNIVLKLKEILRTYFCFRSKYMILWHEMLVARTIFNHILVIFILFSGL